MRNLIPKQGVADVRRLLLSASPCSPDDRSIAKTSLGAAVSGSIRPIDSAVGGVGLD